RRRSATAPPQGEPVSPAIPDAEAVDRVPVLAGRRPWYRQRLWRTLRRGSGLFHVGFLLVVTFAAGTAPPSTHRDPTLNQHGQRPQPPAWQAAGSPAGLLGTDQLGRDVYTRLVYGARISLVVGLGTVLISTALGSVVGLVAGYVEGRLGTGLMRLA